MSHLTPPSMRRFILRRDRDITGTSGVGIVAEGCAFSNGEVWMHWLTPTSSTTRFDCIEDVETIHGHGGDTRVEWIDEDPDEVADAAAIDASNADPGESIPFEALKAELGLDGVEPDVPAGHTQLDAQAGGVWHPCCPALLALGLDCAATPRRPGGEDHSHDHFIAWRSGQAPEAVADAPSKPTPQYWFSTTDPIADARDYIGVLEGQLMAIEDLAISHMGKYGLPLNLRENTDALRGAELVARAVMAAMDRNWQFGVRERRTDAGGIARERIITVEDVDAARAYLAEADKVDDGLTTEMVQRDIGPWRVVK